jgi:hypothetical protein
MLLLHRSLKAGITQEAFNSAGYLETEAALEPKMLVNVGLSRYSGGGATTLNFDGGMSLVTEFDPTKKEAMKPKADGNTVPREGVVLPTTGSVPTEQTGATAASGI